LSRHFSPWIGINEDPVTGSAHSYISTYWAAVLNKREFLGKRHPRGSRRDACPSVCRALTAMAQEAFTVSRRSARQCSPRGGDLQITLLEDGRMRIIGTALPAGSGQAAAGKQCSRTRRACVHGTGRAGRSRIVLEGKLYL